jgi:preprotein translocase subunit SecB
MIAPLQLIDYNAETVSYSRLEPKPAPEDLDVGVGLGFEMGSNPDEERNAQCLTLSVHFNRQEEDIPEEIEPYIVHRGHVRVQGWIRWINEDIAARDNAKHLLLVNGFSMLYGIARVHTAQLTDGSTFDRLLLPSVSFKKVVEEWMQREEETGGDEENV